MLRGVERETQYQEKESEEAKIKTGKMIKLIVSKNFKPQTDSR